MRFFDWSGRSQLTFWVELAVADWGPDSEMVMATAIANFWLGAAAGFKIRWSRSSLLAPNIYPNQAVLLTHLSQTQSCMCIVGSTEVATAFSSMTSRLLEESLEHKIVIYSKPWQTQFSALDPIQGRCICWPNHDNTNKDKDRFKSQML